MRHLLLDRAKDACLPASLCLFSVCLVRTSWDIIGCIVQRMLETWELAPLELVWSIQVLNCIQTYPLFGRRTLLIHPGERPSWRLLILLVPHDHFHPGANCLLEDLFIYPKIEEVAVFGVPMCFGVEERPDQFRAIANLRSIVPYLLYMDDA